MVYCLRQYKILELLLLKVGLQLVEVDSKLHKDELSYKRILFCFKYLLSKAGLDYCRTQSIHLSFNQFDYLFAVRLVSWFLLC
jgi:hypothetical protein